MSLKLISYIRELVESIRNNTNDRDIILNCTYIIRYVDILDRELHDAKIAICTQDNRSICPFNFKCETCKYSTKNPELLEKTP